MLILAFALIAAAQRGRGTGKGGVPSQGPLTSANPFPNRYAAFPQRTGSPTGGDSAGMRPPWWLGLQPLHGAPAFWRAGLFSVPYPIPTLGWDGWSGISGPGFYNAFAPGYPGDLYRPDYFQQASNMADMLPGPYVAQPPAKNNYGAAISAPGPAREPIAARDDTSDAIGPEPGDRSRTEPSSFRIYQEQPRQYPISDEHPPLIALKNRWAYTVVKYWVKGKTFHFITTQGDHMQVPAALVERIYPTPNQGLKTESQLTPTH